jgi:hypothetical protein
MNKCEHKWIDMEDGSLDKFCVKCSFKAKQNFMSIKIDVDAVIDVNEIISNINKNAIRKSRMGT